MASSFSEAFDLIKVKYNFDRERWNQDHPSAPTPVQVPHIKRAIKRREAEVATRLPYWDALIIYLKSNCGVDLGTAIGMASTALSCGCRYATIIENSSASFSWFPETSHWNNAFGIYVGQERKPLRISRCEFALPEVRRLLMQEVLRSAGYDPAWANNYISRRGSLNPETLSQLKELSDRIWPGLFQ